MTENVRKRASKWDLVPETPIPAEAQHSNNDRSEKAGDSDHDKSSNSEWNTSKLSDNQALNLSDVGPKDTTVSKDSGWSNWDRLSGKQEKKDGNGDGNEFSSTAKGWGGDQSSMSPGLDAWRQRSRSRSPKSGWSSSHRSRSRSPSHSFKRETDGWNDRSRGGNQGRFHQDAHSYDGGRHSNSGPTESRGSRQQRSLPTGHADGDIFVDSHGQRGYLRNRHSHGERRKDPERERRIVCNDFLKGKCFRGSMCRYAHQDSSDGHGRWPPNGGRERTHDRKDPVMSFENHQRHTTYRKHNKEPLPCKYFLEGCCRNGASCKFSHLGPMHDSPNWRRRDDRWGPSPDNENSLSGVPRSPKWRCDNSSARVSVSDVEAPEKFLDSHRDQQACYTNKEESRQNCEDLPPWDPLETYQILPNKAPEIPLPANKQETAQEVSILQQHVLNGNSTMEVDLPVNHLPSVVAGTAVSFNPNEQSQQIGLRAPPNPHFPTQMGTEGTVPKPDMKDPRLVLMTPETAIARNMVTSEQVTQITNLSASILPQLYASLNPLAAAGLVPSLAISHPNSVRPLTPLAVPLVQPNQGLWPQIKQYDPISDSMEPANPPANPPGFAPDLVKQQKDSVEELGPPKNSASSTEITEFNNGNHEKTCGFEEKGKFDQKNHISEQDELRRDPEAKEINEGNGNGEKEQEKGNSKDTATSVGQVDEESMKNKEAKGMRMFKFALVELVKEILKPTWKEGHMSKEAHKTIVKKVVDKVTGTLQGPQIPQTQEKIDHYLSFSKPKLEKLVQAYVEKYLNI